jgi:hypothetical protein
MDGHVTDLAALAVDAQMFDAASFGAILDAQAAQFGAAQGVVEEDGEDSEDGAVALAFERAGVRSSHKLPGLGVGARGSCSFIGSAAGTLYAVNGVLQDGVGPAEVIEQVGQCREFAPHRGGGEFLVFEFLAPGDDVRAGDGAELGLFSPLSSLDSLLFATLTSGEISRFESGSGLAGCLCHGRGFGL